MDVIWTLGGPTNSIRASKGGQAIQMERVAAMCKPPKNRAVAPIKGGYENWNAAGCTSEPFRRRIKCVNLILNMSDKGQLLVARVPYRRLVRERAEFGHCCSFRFRFRWWARLRVLGSQIGM